MPMFGKNLALPDGLRVSTARHSTMIALLRGRDIEALGRQAGKANDPERISADAGDVDAVAPSALACRTREPDGLLARLCRCQIF